MLALVTSTNQCPKRGISCRECSIYLTLKQGVTSDPDHYSCGFPISSKTLKWFYENSIQTIIPSIEGIGDAYLLSDVQNIINDKYYADLIAGQIINEDDELTNFYRYICNASKINLKYIFIFWGI